MEWWQWFIIIVVALLIIDHTVTNICRAYTIKNLEDLKKKD